jgi:hypothetical protein
MIRKMRRKRGGRFVRVMILPKGLLISSSLKTLFILG